MSHHRAQGRTNVAVEIFGYKLCNIQSRAWMPDGLSLSLVVTGRLMRDSGNQLF